MEEPEVEAVAEAEQLAADVADAPAEDIAEAEAFAEAGIEADEVEEAEAAEEQKPRRQMPTNLSPRPRPWRSPKSRRWQRQA